MNFFKKIINSLPHLTSNDNQVVVKNINVPSKYLERGVNVDIFLPPQYSQNKKQIYPTIYFNDGQDMPALGMLNTLNRLFEAKSLQPIIIVAISCNANRMNEYGTIREWDYKNRGNKAGEYADFVIHELVPYINSEFRCSTNSENTAFAGFSLGGLSALDIAWANPSVFGKVGVFSGSLWWRSKEWTPEDPDGGRIMHDVINQSQYQKGMKFWFEVGTKDEESDRNNNGIIDSIDDTCDLMDELFRLGYQPHEDVKYVEIEDGEHNPHTWGKVMPEFLLWAFGQELLYANNRSLNMANH